MLGSRKGKPVIPACRLSMALSFFFFFVALLY
jgi:hypothetical protein